MKTNKKYFALLATSAVVSLGIGLIGSSEAQAASEVTSSTPGSPVDPSVYNVFLEAGDPLTVPVEITVPGVPNKLDLFLIQDLSGSFSDDVSVVQSLGPSLVSGVQALVGDTQFGIGSYIDKPVSPFGSFGNYEYMTDLALTSNTSDFQSTLDGLSATGGNDFPESQLSALLQAAVRPEIGFRSDAFRTIVLTTDAAFHVAGDFVGAPPNNGDGVLDGDPPGTGEDYPSVAQIRDALSAANIQPIFAVTSGVTSIYEDLVDELGFGTVVPLSSNSSDIVSSIETGLGDVFRNITLNVEGDDFGYVQGISPGSFADVPEGESRTFSVDLLADGIDDENDTFELISPGFGTTIVNVDIEDDDVVVEEVPEPTTILGTILAGTFANLFRRKRKKQEVA